MTAKIRELSPFDRHLGRCNMNSGVVVRLDGLPLASRACTHDSQFPERHFGSVQCKSSSELHCLLNDVPGNKHLLFIDEFVLITLLIRTQLFSASGFELNSRKTVDRFK